MSFLGSTNKQPREKLPIDISYALVIGDRAADSIALTIETPTGMVLESSSTDAAGKLAQLFVSGGTSGTTYHWTVLADITIGGKVTRVEDEFSVAVSEVNSSNYPSGGAVVSPFGGGSASATATWPNLFG
jgi:hypothetical protein